MMRLKDSGEGVWSQQFGGSGFGSQRLFSLEPTQDGGYILGGHCDRPPSGNKTSPNFGDCDFWVLKQFPDQSHQKFLPTTNATDEIRFALQTSYFATYAIERSADLISWQPWQTNWFSGDTLEFVDENTNLTSEVFYRARRLP